MDTGSPGKPPTEPEGAATLPDASAPAKGLFGGVDDTKVRRILGAAQLEFFEQGFSQAKIESIARRAHVAIATVYSYFPGKSDIFHAVVTLTVNSVDPVGEALERHRNDDARGRLMTFALVYATTIASPFARGLSRGVIAQQPQFPDLARRASDQAYKLTGGHLMTLIGELHAAGALNAPDAELASALLQGMLDLPTLMVGLLYGDDAEPTIALPRLCEEAVETFLARYGTAKL